jgi:gamma-glutamyltranspeptidase
MKESTGRVFPDPMPSPGEDGCHHLVTVPGACAGWCDAVEKWGTMDMATYVKIEWRSPTTLTLD